MNNENGQYSLSYYSKIICKTEVSGALPQAWSIREKSHCRRDFNKKYLFVKFILACRSQERDDIRAAEGWVMTPLWWPVTAHKEMEWSQGRFRLNIRNIFFTRVTTGGCLLEHPDAQGSGDSTKPVRVQEVSGQCP